MVRAALAVLGVALAGCAGTLDDPDDWVDGPAECELAIDVETDLLMQRCTGSVCHEGAAPAGGMDLASPGIAGRVLDVPSATCAGYRRVDPEDPGDSLIWHKLHPNPPCGEQMPYGMTELDEQELECVRAWIDDISGL